MACVFLLGFLGQAVLAQVPTPTNVTLQCHNMHNVLRWNYDQLTPGLKFKVIVASENTEAVELWVDSPTLHIDLSSFSDPDDNYYVSVSAVVGDDVSKPSAGKTYSYFQDAINVDQICTLDFPAVNVTVLEDSVIHFRFMHPELLYPKLKRRKSHTLRLFDYTVTVNNQSNHLHRFYCDKEVCQEKSIPVDHGQEKHCVHVEGTLRKMSVQATQEYCSSSEQPSDKNKTLWLSLGLSLGTLVLLIGIISVMICMKKIRPPTSMNVPQTLKSNGINNEHLVSERDEDEMCVVQVEPLSSTRLLSTTDVNESTLVDAPSIESEFRVPIRAWTKDGGAGDQAEAMQDDAEEAGYKKGNDLDEDSLQNLDFSGDSGYEKRNALG